MLSSRSTLSLLFAALALFLAGCDQPSTSAGNSTDTPQISPAPDAGANNPQAGANAPGGAEGEKPAKPVQAVMTTSLGVMELELYPDKAPITVKNFVNYAKKGHYDGTIFHRVVEGFVIQGGGYTRDFQEKPTEAPIKNEAANGLKNERGTLSMARTSDPDSATSQFYVNLKHNQALDYRDDTAGGIGYAVFGKVTKGMDVVDKIARVPVEDRPPIFENVPVQPVIIRSVKIKQAPEGGAGKE
jgi:peptidyl-prolyl cis-trans isomerase A (cyclophilin A)